MKDEVIKLLENEDFVQKLIVIENVKDTKKLFKDKGVEVSDSDIDELGEIVNKMIEILEKMPEEKLKAISGGKNADMSGETPQIVLAKDHCVPGADCIRKAVGFRPKMVAKAKGYDSDKTGEWMGVYCGYESTGSKYKDFVGEYANEIASAVIGSVMTLAFVEAISKGNSIIKKGLGWYRRKYSNS